MNRIRRAEFSSWVSFSEDGRMKKSHLPSLWSQRLVEYLFLLWDFRVVSSCFAWILFLVEFFWRFTWILKPSSGELWNLNLELTLFCQILCLVCHVLFSLVLFGNFVKFYNKKKNQFFVATRWQQERGGCHFFPSVVFILNCQRDCSFFLWTLPGKSFLNTVRMYFTVCPYSFASHFSSHLTITLRVDVLTLFRFCWRRWNLSFVQWISSTYRPVPL